MERPYREHVKTVRLTQEEHERYKRLRGYRGLWEFSQLIRAGLELLHQEEQEFIAAARPLPAPPPAAKPRRKKP